MPGKSRRAGSSTGVRFGPLSHPKFVNEFPKPDTRLGDVFIGHFAVGFASKRLAPRTSLGWLLFAPLFADVLWPILVLAGIEHVRIDPGNTEVTPLDFVSYPWSHSLALDLVWGAALGGVAFALWRDKRVAAVLFVGVVSHWVLDVVTHRPDMPFAPGVATKVGLGLWRSLPLTLVVEVAMFAAGLAVYLRATRAKRPAGTWGLVAFVTALLAVYVGVLCGPPPPSVRAIGWSGLASLVLFLPVWAFDRAREAR
jgi:membrane-bound metal-dependent hydrolase YbcI (DUF457 family)